MCCHSAGALTSSRPCSMLFPSVIVMPLKLVMIDGSFPFFGMVRLNRLGFMWDFSLTHYVVYVHKICLLHTVGSNGRQILQTHHLSHIFQPSAIDPEYFPNPEHWCPCHNPLCLSNTYAEFRLWKFRKWNWLCTLVTIWIIVADHFFSIGMSFFP